MVVGDTELKLPAVWLSQGYQAVISLVADIIGNIWLEAGEPVELDEMEGIVLEDELDLHLHPTWQTEIVTGLRSAAARPPRRARRPASPSPRGSCEPMVVQIVAENTSRLVVAACDQDKIAMALRVGNAPRGYSGERAFPR